MRWKLVLLGNTSAGKSSLVLRFVKNQFAEYQESTIGAAFLTRRLQLKQPRQGYGQKEIHLASCPIWRGHATMVQVFGQRLQS